MLDCDENQILDGHGNRKRKANLFALGSRQVNATTTSDLGLIYDIKLKEYIKYLCGTNHIDKEITKITNKRLNAPKIAVSHQTS